MKSEAARRKTTPLLWAVAVAMALASILWPGSMRSYFFAFFAMWALAIAAAVGSLMAERRGERRAPIWIQGLLASIVVLSIAVGQWPLRLAVLASSPILHRMVKDAEAGRFVHEPRFAGLIPIKATRRQNDMCIIVLSDDSDGGSYLIRGESNPGSSWEEFPVVLDWRYFDED